MVIVWRVDLDAPADDRDLSPDERTRAAAFRLRRERARFIAARAALRSILAAELGCPAKTLRFAYGPHGKPGLAGETRPSLAFSVTRSRELGLIAISRSGPVGVDCEYIDESVDLAPLAARFPGAPAGPHDFYHWWTVLEARVKLAGHSLAAELDASRVPNVPVASFEVDGRWAAALAHHSLPQPFRIVPFGRE